MSNLKKPLHFSNGFFIYVEEKVVKKRIGNKFIIWIKLAKYIHYGIIYKKYR
jgi:hypothetical protein